MHSIPNDYDYSEGLIFRLDQNNNKMLVLPIEPPTGNTIAEKYIRHIFSENEADEIFDIELPYESDIYDAVFPNCSENVIVNEAIMWQLVESVENLCQVLVNEIDSIPDFYDSDPDYFPSDSESDSQNTCDTESDSESGVIYDTKQVGSNFSCSCPHFRYRIVTPCTRIQGCKHILHLK